VIIMADDNIQHGIDDNPHNDAEKGAALGGLGGAAVGAAAGSAAGPIGTVVGAVAGGLAGAGASGAAVGAVDQVDNDNTVTGLGDGATRDVEDQVHDATHNNS
jgi:outer membrane lipoprotein SlyB